MHDDKYEKYQFFTTFQAKKYEKYLIEKYFSYYRLLINRLLIEYYENMRNEIEKSFLVAHRNGTTFSFPLFSRQL